MFGITTGGAILIGAVAASGAAVYASKQGADAAGDAAKISSDSSLEAAKILAAAEEKSAAAELAFQYEGLNYLMQSEALPMEYRDMAYGVLGELYGTEPGQNPSADSFFNSPLAQRLEINQGELINTAKNSPLYAALMGTQAAGEDSIMRNAGATGGLRSGNVQHNLYDYNVQLGKNSLLQAYDRTFNEEMVEQNNLLSMVSGLKGLAGYGGNSNAVASQYSALGQTAGQGALGVGQAQAVGVMGVGNAQAGGVLGAANAWQQGMQNVGNIGLSALGTYYMMNPGQNLGTIGGAGGGYNYPGASPGYPVGVGSAARNPAF